MQDRSICAMRALKPDYDGSIFWFRDDLHQPFPISPMGMTTVQKHHAWGYHFAAEETQLPPSEGACVKIHMGRVYLGFAMIEDQEKIAKRAVEFEKLIEKCIDNWKIFYDGFIDEVSTSLEALSSVDGDGLTVGELLDYLRKSEAVNRRNWEIHFILMYPADAIYLLVEDYCKKYGLEEKDYISLLKGFEGMPAKTDEELWGLAVSAKKLELTEAFNEENTQLIREALSKTDVGKDWLVRFEKFLDIYGNRIAAAHLDVLFPTWKEEPKPVFDTINSYFQRIDEGWDLYQARGEVRQHRDKSIEAFETKISGEDMAEFRRLLKVGQQVYAYQEDHGFYIDQGSTAQLHYTLMACGRRLCKFDLIDETEDVFFLNYSELDEVLSDFARNEKVALIHYKPLLRSLIIERKKSWKEARNLEAPLTLGAVPETMTDPIAIKVFGIIDEVLHPKDEQKVSDELKGFPASAGVIVGKARVILDHHEFACVQSGEILVAPFTGTAWTPLFLKIGGVVTDTGGMLTHAAIAAREYGIPAVVGTWNATHSINTGDTVKIDGEKGTVSILERISDAAE